LGALLHHARRYVAALRVAREIRSLPESISPSEALAFAQRRPWYGGDSIAVNQKPQEILELLEILRSRPPRAVLEIGMDKGGTLFLWTRVAQPDALLVSVDIRPVAGRLGLRSPFGLVRRSFARAEQRVVFVDGADSHDTRTLDRIRKAAAGRSFDFLFVDGDHRYGSVKRDYELYAPLVEPGGVIAFHDVSPAPTPDTEGTARFWRELAGGSENAVELLAEGELGYGIGVLHVAGR
jgi:cephalosporin hydroxylase